MTKQFLMLLAAFATVAVLTSCDSTTDPGDPVVTAPDAPTELMATSTSSTSVSVKWTAATSGQAATGYIVKVEEVGSGSPQELEIDNPNTVIVDISGLVEGTVYEFTAYAVNDTARSGPSPTIKWSPASRHNTVMRLYETDSDMGSGIELPNTAGLTISQGGMWDVCLDTRDELFDIGSPTLSSYTDEKLQPEFPNGDVARVTLFGKVWTDVASLDDVFESADLTNETLQEKLLRFNTADSTGKQFAFVVKTAAGHFAKVLVKAADGKLLQGTAPDRYVELEVSYQNGNDVPYAVIAKSTQNKFTKKINGVIETNVKKAF